MLNFQVSLFSSRQRHPASERGRGAGGGTGGELTRNEHLLIRGGGARNAMPTQRWREGQTARGLRRRRYFFPLISLSQRKNVHCCEMGKWEFQSRFCLPVVVGLRIIEQNGPEMASFVGRNGVLNKAVSVLPISNLNCCEGAWTACTHMALHQPVTDVCHICFI